MSRASTLAKAVGSNGDITVSGSTTLGDAAGDNITINASTASIPNNLNFDSNTLFVDATNNRIGIGTATPAYSLEVNGTFRASGATTLSSTLGVSGTSTLAAVNASGLVAMAGAATVGTTLGVTGATTLSSTLAVTGAGTFSSTLGVTGRITGTVDVWAGTLATGVGLATTSGALDVGSGTGIVGTGTAMDLRVWNGAMRFYTNNGSLGMTISNAATPAITIPGTLGVTGLINGGLLIPTSERMGFGVTPPTDSIASYKDFFIGATGVLEGQTNYIGMNDNTYRKTGGSYVYITTNKATIYNQSEGVHAWGTYASGTAAATLPAASAGMSLGLTGLSVTGTLGVTGLITSTAGNNALIFNSATATTGYQYCNISNTSGNVKFGVEGSVAATMQAGDTAYDGFIHSLTGMCIGVADGATLGLRISSAGAVTIPGQLSFVTSAASPSTTIGNTGNGDTGFLLTMLATNALKNWQHSFNNYSAGYSIHYSTVNGGSTFNSSNVAINFGETGAVTIPGTLSVTDNTGMGQAAAVGGRLAITFSGPNTRGYYGIDLTGQLTTSEVHLRFNNPNGAVGSVTTSGSATAYNTSSDYRLKHDVAPMVGALERVNRLNPVTYKWNVDKSDGEGFLAHELQEVIPQCVTGEKDKMEMEEYEISPAVPATYDEENKELTPAVDAVMGEREVPAYQGVDTSFLIATLTAAIQELAAKVAKLEAA